jgi:hypothetical protein
VFSVRWYSATVGKNGYEPPTSQSAVTARSFAEGTRRSSFYPRLPAIYEQRPGGFSIQEKNPVIAFES